MNLPISTTISMDASGRLVLPKSVRERLNLSGGQRFQASVVAGKVELLPVSDEARPEVRQKSGVMVLARTGKAVDAAAAIAAERGDQEDRGRRR